MLRRKHWQFDPALIRHLAKLAGPAAFQYFSAHRELAGAVRIVALFGHRGLHHCSSNYRFFNPAGMRAEQCRRHAGRPMDYPNECRPAPVESE
jgi:hypothetical protein